MAGGPQVRIEAYLAAAVAGLLLVGSLAREFCVHPARGALFLTAIVLAPAGVIATSGFEYVYPRHFLVPMIFGYVAVGCQMARWWQRGNVGHGAVALLLAGYVGCNAVPVARLIANGRSQDAAALSWVVEHSDGSGMTISGEHNFRVGLPLMFYVVRNDATFQTLDKRKFDVWRLMFYMDWNESHFRSSGKDLKFVKRETYPPGGTDWRLLLSSSEWDPPRPAQIVDDFHNRYELVKVFPATSLSAFTWWIYRRQ